MLGRHSWMTPKVTVILWSLHLYKRSIYVWQYLHSLSVMPHSYSVKSLNVESNLPNLIFKFLILFYTDQNVKLLERKKNYMVNYIRTTCGAGTGYLIRWALSVQNQTKPDYNVFFFIKLLTNSKHLKHAIQFAYKRFLSIAWKTQ